MSEPREAAPAPHESRPGRNHFDATLPPATHFRARVLQDSLNEGLSRYWLRRADQLEAARPRPEDFHGNRSLDERRHDWRQLTAMAAACRARARVALAHDQLDPDLLEALAEAEEVAEDG